MSSDLRTLETKPGAASQLSGSEASRSRSGFVAADEKTLIRGWRFLYRCSFPVRHHFHRNEGGVTSACLGPRGSSKGEHTQTVNSGGSSAGLDALAMRSRLVPDVKLTGVPFGVGTYSSRAFFRPTLSVCNLVSLKVVCYFPVT
ncbi:hypothetical protein Bca4012_064719 [Brassica carinata]